MLWWPYQSVMNELPAICRDRTEMELWFYRGPIIFFWIVEFYTPERVMRQLGRIQAVPPPQGSNMTNGMTLGTSRIPRLTGIGSMMSKLYSGQCDASILFRIERSGVSRPSEGTWLGSTGRVCELCTGADRRPRMSMMNHHHHQRPTGYTKHTQCQAKEFNER